VLLALSGEAAVARWAPAPPSMNRRHDHHPGEISMKSWDTERGEPGARLESRFARSLRAAASVGVLGAALVSASAFAGTKFLDVQIDPLVPQTAPGVFSASYSGANGAINAAFRATITNNTTSDVNNAWFRVHTTLNGGPGPLFAGAPSQCSIDSQVQPVGSGLVCQVTLLFAVPAPSVALTFVVPTPNAPGDNGTSQLRLEWSIQAGQGKGNSNPSNVVQNDSKAITLSVGSARDGVSSYVTANSSLTVTLDLSNTQVKPPKDVPVNLKQVDDDPSYLSCLAIYKKCLTSTLTIVDPVTSALVTFDPTSPLVVNLIRSASTLNDGALISSAVLHYVGTDGSYDIIPCASDGLGGWTIPLTTPASSRCMIPLGVDPTDPSQGTYVDATTGDWHFRVLALTNGIMNW
jgi:hypothetical protein